MEQNTNAIAGLKLEPNRSNGIGRIVEEHVRYWRQYKDREEAEEMARKAREQEFNFKANNKALELYEGIKPGDNKGFLNSQIIDLYEKKKPEILELSRAIANGDPNAVLKYATIKENFARLTKINEVYGKKGEELAKDEENYNEILDKPIKDFRESLSKGLYALNDDFTVSVMVNGKEEPTIIDSSALLDNEYLQNAYSGKAKFEEYGKIIAKGLLDNNDGQEVITPRTKNKGILQVKTLFEENSVEGRSAYGVYVESLKEKNEKELTDFEKSLLQTQPKFSELSSIQLTKIAEDYYNRNVAPRIQQTFKDTYLERETKNEALTGKKLENESKRLEILKKQEELKGKTTGGGKGNKDKEFKVEAQTDQKGRLALTTNINGDDAVVFGGFKSFDVILDPETDEKIKIEELILTDGGDLTYRDPSGKEDAKKEVIDRIVNYLGYDDVKDLFEQMKENRDVKLKKIQESKKFAPEKESKKQDTKKENTFDPTKF